MSRDEHDARQIAHLQSLSRSGETVDHAHRFQAGTRGSEDRRRKDHFLLSNATVPLHTKAALNRLELGAAFSVMWEDGVKARLVGAREAFRLIDRTRFIDIRAVKNPMCNTPKAPRCQCWKNRASSSEVERRSRTLRSWFEEVSVDLVCKVLPHTVRNCAWQITHRLVRFNIFSESHRRLLICQKGMTSGACECGWARSWCQVDIGEVHLREFEGADPYGDTQRMKAGTESRRLK